MTESICQCVEEGDSDVHLQVIKCLVTLISNFTCKVHDSSLLDGFRASYKIHLSTSNSTNQTVSKVSLHQMMTTVFSKMEAYSGNFGVDIQTIQRSLDAKFSTRKKPATKLQKDFGVTELAVSSFFNDEDDSVERSREEPERVGTQINFSAMDQYLYMLCQNMVDSVCIYQERRAALIEDIEMLEHSEAKDGEAENIQRRLEEHKQKLQSLPIKVVEKKHSKSKGSMIKVELANEKGIISGKFGWCIMCRKEANLYCKNSMFPICSLDCKNRLLNLLESAEAERISSPNHNYNNEEMKRHFTDAILLFKSICKLFMKADPTNMNTYTLKSQIMGLELILNVVEKPGATFLTRPEFINIIKTSLCNGLLKHCVSNEKTVFALSISIFYALFVHFREHLKYEILVLIEEIFLKVLNSGNSNYHHKYLILRVFDKIAKNTKHLIEIFVNYDCDVESRDILESMINTLSKIAQGKFAKTEHANMLNEKEEHSLKLYALKILASIVSRLNQFLTEEQRDIAKEEHKTQNSGGLKHDVEDEEEQSPHFLQQTSQSDISISIDPKKDNYEKNRQLKSNINKAASKFNLKPKKGVEYLLHFNQAQDLTYDQKLELIVNFLKSTPTLDKTAIGDYLGEDIQINKDVFYKLVDGMNFYGKPFVPALKILLAGFRLPGEGQKVDRIMEKFGEKFVQDNPDQFESSEDIYTLSYATMMLQTSLHNPNARNHFMTLDDFKNLIKELIGKKGIDQPFVEEVYRTIETDPITLVEDDEARLKNESTAASSYKRKQEIFLKEGQGLAKRGHELMKEKKKTNVFVLVNDSEAIGPLFELCWSAMFAVFSMLLEEYDDPNILRLCIDGLIHSIKISGFYGMDMERNAFVGSLVKFTGICKIADNESVFKHELTDKNIRCTEAVLHLAMHEGNYLSKSWVDILKVVSMVNLYQAIGTGAKGFSELDFEQESKGPKLDPEIEAIKYQNAAQIISNIDEHDIDKVFSNSVGLGYRAVSDFIESMCIVSVEELNKREGPRTFLLQKLVEVTDLNMNRARHEFSQMWRSMKDHISSVGSHNNERVAEFAIDSLRQLAKKFLEKEELNNYHFQKDFLEPFNVIMLHNMPARMNLIHYIMSCMCLFARQMTSNIRSGWEIIIEIFKFGGENDSYDLSAESIQTLNIILQEENFQYIEEYFEKIVNCLVKFMNNRFEDHAELAINLLGKVAGYLGQRKDLIPEIIKKSKIVFSTKEEKEQYKKSLWKSILYELSKKSFEIQTKVTEQASDLMFSLLEEYNSKMGSELWELVFRDLLKAMFDDVHIKIESKSTDAHLFQIYETNVKVMISNMNNLISTMDNKHFVLSTEIFLDTVTNFSKNYPNSIITVEMLDGMNDFTEQSGKRFDDDLWKKFIDVICKLFDNKHEKSLLEDTKEETKDQKGESKFKLTKMYENQAAKLLHLINNTHKIAIIYKKIQINEINKLLTNLENAYDIVNQFNLNIKKRYYLFEKIDLRASQDKIPILLKHQIKCLDTYYIFLNQLYFRPNQDIDKKEVVKKIIDFTLKILTEFSQTYEKMLQLIVALKSKDKDKVPKMIDSVSTPEYVEEMNRFLVSISHTVSNSVLTTLQGLDKEDMVEHAQQLTPVLID